VDYAHDVGMRAAARHFGLARRTVRTWCRRWKADGDAGLVPRYPARRRRRVSERIVELARVARTEHQWGATRTRIWLERVHQIRVNAKTIQRVFCDLGMPFLTKTPKRRPKQLKLFEKDAPGDSIQVDVKVARVKGTKVFQYTALDDCTRMRVLRLYTRLNQHSSLHFLGEVQRALPFPIKKLQCDNGVEFPLAFKLAVEPAGIKHRYIKPRRPQQNGKVERSHRVDAEEFWSRHDFDTVPAAEASLAGWERRYNHDRFSLALGGRTPMEKLRAVLPGIEIPQSQLSVQGASTRPSPSEGRARRERRKWRRLVGPILTTQYTSEYARNTMTTAADSPSS
jgi:transposase InsO family protein